MSPARRCSRCSSGASTASLHGIALDRKITEDEITGLNDWLLDNEDLRGHWPFNDAFVLIEKILEDGVVTEEEKSEFMEFYRSFSEVPVPSPEIHDEEYLKAFMTSDTPCLPPDHVHLRQGG